MHAEEDDIPEHLRFRKKGSSRPLAVVAIGSVITGALMLMFARPVVIDVTQLRKAVRFDGEQVFNEPYQSVEQAPLPRRVELQYRQPQTELKTHRKPPSRTVEQQPAERQTSFNDQNYTPSGAVNVVSTENKPVFRQEAPARRGLVVSGIKQKDRKDICDIFKSGSLERRGCRQRMDLNSRGQ